MADKQVHKQPDKRDVMVNFNPKGKQTMEKQWHEKPKKRDMMIDINFEGEYDDKKMVEKQVCTQPEQRVSTTRRRWWRTKYISSM
jgi:hypothetical protein